MKSLKIVVNFNGSEPITSEVKSECAMWNFLRAVRDELSDEQLKSGVRAVVIDADGNPFKDITFKKNSKGKIEMPNSVKETNRIRIKKTMNENKKKVEEAAIKAFKAHDNEEVAPSGATNTELADILNEAGIMAAKAN